MMLVTHALYGVRWYDHTITKSWLDQDNVTAVAYRTCFNSIRGYLCKGENIQYNHGVRKII